MRLDEYLRTRTFELVVHGLDIGAASGVDPAFDQAAAGRRRHPGRRGRRADRPRARPAARADRPAVAAGGFQRRLSGGFRHAVTGHEWAGTGACGVTLRGTFALGREEISVSRDLHVWRPAAAVSWSEAVLGALLASVAVVAAASRPWEWLGWLLLVPSAWLLLGTRRACRLRSDDLVAQGRVFRRVVALRDVRQAGIALGGRPWLQTQDGAVTRAADGAAARLRLGTPGAHAGRADPVGRGRRPAPGSSRRCAPPSSRRPRSRRCSGSERLAASSLRGRSDSVRSARLAQASMTTGMIIGRRLSSRLTQRPTTRRTVCWSW